MDHKLKKKKFLINGGLGMIGSTIAKKLVEAEAKVTIVDAMVEPFGANLFNIDKIKDKVSLHFFDIKDTVKMKRAVEGKDVILNLAGQIAHNDSIINPLYDAKMNYLYQLNVIFFFFEIFSKTLNSFKDLSEIIIPFLDKIFLNKCILLLK